MASSPYSSSHSYAWLVHLFRSRDGKTPRRDYVANRGNFLCSCSHYTAERSRELFRLGESKIATLHNPVVTETSSGERKRRPGQVVFSGTLTAKKGVGSLVRARAQVLEDCTHAE